MGTRHAVRCHAHCPRGVTRESTPVVHTCHRFASAASRLEMIQCIAAARGAHRRRRCGCARLRERLQALWHMLPAVESVGCCSVDAAMRCPATRFVGIVASAANTARPVPSGQADRVCRSVSTDAARLRALQQTVRVACGPSPAIYRCPHYSI